jgi:hypothetical protein
VRLGPSTPGDYVRARVLVPLKSGCDTFEVVKKHERHSGRKDFFSRKKFDAEGGSPLLAPEGGSGFAEARSTLP